MSKLHSHNSNHVMNKISEHVVNNVTNEDNEPYSNIVSASNELHIEFVRVANYEYNLYKFPSVRDRFSDYLSGLPFHFEYMVMDIELFFEKIELKYNKDADFNSIINLYRGLIFNCMMNNKTY